jgi:hypothetical protein
MLKRVIVGAAVVAAALAAAGPDGAAGSPAAQMTGGDIPPALPSLVQTRLKRVERALDRLTDDVNEDDAAHAAKAGKVVRRQLASAWRGAKYYIKNPPPAPAEDAGARIAGGGSEQVIADPVMTAMAVFDEFHNVTGTVMELTDGARVPVLDAMSRTLYVSLDRRDQAIQSVHELAPPVAEDAGVRAKASGDGEAAMFDMAMPGLTLFLDDEIQQIDALQSDAADLPPGAKRILTKARAKIAATKAQINALWPPVTED